MALKVSLDQWQAFVAVVEQGGYAQAADHLYKSQSTVTYGVQKLEQALGVKVLTVKGRKAELTPAGNVLFQRARQLLAEAKQIESLANHFGDSWEPEITLAVEALFPSNKLFTALERFQVSAPQTRINVRETVLSGSDEALTKKRVQLSITGRVPQGFIGEHLMRVPFILAAAPSHPLHAINKTRLLDWQDLRQHCQLVISDSGPEQKDSGWLEASQRLTFSNPAFSMAAAVKGLGFAWFPKQKIDEHLDSGALKPLAMQEGFVRYVDLYLVMTEGNASSPAVQALASCIKEAVKQDNNVKV